MWKSDEIFIVNKNLPQVILNKNYSAINYRVLFTLMNRISYNNRIQTIRQMKLAEEINTSQSNISKSLRKLQNDEIIEKREHDYYFTEKYIKSKVEGVKK